MFKFQWLIMIKRENKIWNKEIQIIVCVRYEVCEISTSLRNMLIENRAILRADKQ